MNIGIVGHEAAKFTLNMEEEAKGIITQILLQSFIETGGVVLISGGCHLGGVDIWADEIAAEFDIPRIIHLPKRRSWSGGYKERNLLIAKDSGIVHVVVVTGYHDGYRGMRFDRCYHCGTSEHVKSGACWTAKQAIKLGRGKSVQWHLIPVS